MTSLAEPIDVLIVDDHAVVREGLRAFLDHEPGLKIVGLAKDGADGVRLADEFVPDVVLMDLIMPGLDGVEATRQIKAISPRSQVVVLTSYHDDEHIFPALKAGALSYVLKDIGPEALAEVIRQASRGESVFHPRVAARLMTEMRAVSDLDPLSTLTAREHEVLRLIADGQSNGEIAAELVITERTVKGHVSNILGKLYLSDRTQAAVLAWRKGVMK